MGRWGCALTLLLVLPITGKTQVTVQQFGNSIQVISTVNSLTCEMDNIVTIIDVNCYVAGISGTVVQAKYVPLSINPPGTNPGVFASYTDISGNMITWILQNIGGTVNYQISTLNEMFAQGSFTSTSFILVKKSDVTYNACQLGLFNFDDCTRIWHDAVIRERGNPI
jgi:hypothetical protein